MHGRVIGDGAGVAGDQRQRRGTGVADQLAPDAGARVLDRWRCDARLRQQPAQGLHRALCRRQQRRHFQHVAARRVVAHHPGGQHLVGRIDHRGHHLVGPHQRQEGVAQRKNRQRGQGGVRRRQLDRVPPGDAVLREDDPRLRTDQGRQLRRRRGEGRALDRDDDQVLDAEIGGRVAGLDPRAKGLAADFQAQAVALDRVELGPACGDRHRVPVQREPDREEAADRTGAEDVDAHAGQRLQGVVRRAGRTAGQAAAASRMPRCARPVAGRRPAAPGAGRRS